MDTSHKAMVDACASLFKAAIRQNWYRLKQEYFVSIPANEIPATSLPTMNDGQWRELVDMWSSLENNLFYLGVLSNMYL
jgi:hypothetical protein